MKSNLLKQMFIFVVILSFTNGNAQNYFPLMSNQNKEILRKTFSSFKTITITEEEKISLLLDTAFNNKIDSFSNTWYSGHLLVLEEPVIYSDSTNIEIIRFTWLRTFHNPIIIRIVNNEEIVFIYWKKSNGAGGYNPGNLIVNEKKRIESQQWTEIVQKLEKSKFWEISTNYPRFGLDGAQWILEAKIGNKYHVVDRWSGDDSEIGQFCLDLLKMTDLKIKKREIY